MYSIKSHYDNRLRRLTNTHLNKDEKPVQNGLALTPADLARMTANGIPISTQNLETMYSEGSLELTYDVPLDQQRGIDAADLFQAAETAKKNLKRAKNKMAAKMNELSSLYMRKAENNPEKI